jgi:predicted MFS family arabinose efflux permease
MKEKNTFSRYEVFVIAVLAILQFTIVLDFMIINPLAAILLDELNVTTKQFAMVVSAYAISAGISGILAAGFADRFDRKKMLLFFYSGFLLGTFLCGIAPSYDFLLGARIITGLFGGVLGAVISATITDLFAFQVRGRVMGFVQMAFASSQVLGIPLGLLLATRLSWHWSFLMIVIVGVPIGLLIAWYMKPINAHLKNNVKRNAFLHLAKTVNQRNYMKGFGATVLLATGGFMLMPFGTAFSVNNLGITLDELVLLNVVTGLCAMITGPLVGILSDKVGKFQVFLYGSILTMITVVIYCNLGTTPFWIVTAISAVMFVGVSSRIISSQALITAVPEPMDRGAFMSINSSVQYLSGGIATFIAGLIVQRKASGALEHYDTLGYVIVGTTTITIIMMYILDRYITAKSIHQKPVLQPEPVAEIK